MGFKISSGFALAVILVALVSFPDVTLATKFVVGDSNHWQFGFNYSDWAIKNSPFYQYDSLVFMYDSPSNNTFPHSVYLLRNMKAFTSCDLKGAKLVGNVMQGGGQGLEFVLKKRKPHYFACGEHDGVHCNLGLMKFAVLPVRSHCRS